MQSSVTQTGAYPVQEVPARYITEALAAGGLRLGLRPELEAGYLRYKDENSLWLLRLGCFVAVALYAVFFLLDALTQKRLTEPAIFYIAFGVAYPATLLPALATYIVSWRPHARWLAAATTAVNGAALIACITIAARVGKALPYEVLALNLMFAFYLAGALFQTAFPLAAATVAVYLASAWWLGIPTVELLDRAFVLVAVTMLGGIFGYLFERAERRSWLRAQLVAQMAVRDELTGLYNRRHLYEHGRTVLEQAHRDGKTCGLLLLDVDHFKLYNDTQGHAAGDRCLIRIARALRKSARSPLDVVARNGGEEFAVLLYDIAPDALLEQAQALRQEIKSLRIPHPESPFGHVTVSLGVASGGAALEPMLLAADRALYRAKHGGRDQVQVGAP